LYLRELFVKNSGPLRELQINFAFTPEDRPIPHLIVGRNGSGKTNLLSLIADALMEGAADVYRDILTPTIGAGRNWFRVVGAKTVSYNEAGGFSILRFEHNGQQIFYRENAGQFTAAQAKAIIPPTLDAGATWPDNGENGKIFSIDEKTVRSIYHDGAHVFFPSSRSETPFWLNEGSLFEDTYDTTENFQQNLRKPIFVEHGTDLFAQWLLGVLTESRFQLDPAPIPNTAVGLPGFLSNLPISASATGTLQFANRILQAITDDPQARFYWAGRQLPRKVGVASGNQILAAGLDGLSGGQSTLLAIFGTILRYGDTARIAPQDLQGIVVIDELDAHMHIDLQMKALPDLIAQFPRLQFIMSSHSPFFALGMEKRFPDGGVRIIDMPEGLPKTAEAYDEFESAIIALRQTQAFETEITKELSASEATIIWVSGPTDERYFKTAARLLGYDELVDCFRWIGAPSSGGGSFNTGDKALNSALSLLKANPMFSRRKVIIIYDSDANRADESNESVFIIGLEQVPDRRIQRGIENLLRPEAIPQELYKARTDVSEYGETVISEKLDKTALCDLLCGDDADAANFEYFRPYLDRINEIMTRDAGGGQQDGSNPTDDAAADSSPEQS
jgi:energy-coupling factor transporter ATP-binding protein EcfA2